MSCSSQPFFNGPHRGVPPTYERLQEEHEVAVLGAPQPSGAVTSTVINIRGETVVPDHVIWSLFNTVFFNPCCLGFAAFAYSVKVGGRVGASPESASGPQRCPGPDGLGRVPWCTCRFVTVLAGAHSQWGVPWGSGRKGGRGLASQAFSSR